MGKSKKYSALLCMTCVAIAATPSYAMSLKPVNIINNTSTSIKEDVSAVPVEEHTYEEFMDDEPLEDVELKEIQINGEKVNITPYPIHSQEDYSTMIPFAPIAKALGVNVTYDGETQEITAIYKDVQLKFNIGQDQYTLTNKGKVEEREWYGALPKFIGNATYVESGIFYSAFGFTEGTSFSDRSYIIINPDVYVDAFKKADLKNLNRLISYQKNTDHFTQNGDFSLEFSFDSQTFGTQIKGSTKATITSILNGENAYLNLNVKNEGLMNLYTALLKIASEETRNLPSSFSMDDPIRGEFLIRDNHVYFKSNFVNLFFIHPDSNVLPKEGQWIEVDSSLEGEMEKVTDLSSLNYDTLVELLIKNFTRTYYADAQTYEKNMATIKMLSYLFSDDLLKVEEKEDGMIVTYHLTTSHLSKALTAYEILSKFSDRDDFYALEYIKNYLSAIDTNVDASMELKNHQIISSEMKGSFTLNNIPNSYHIDIGKMKVNFQAKSKSEINKGEVPKTPTPDQVVKLSDMEEDRAVPETSSNAELIIMP